MAHVHTHDHDHHHHDHDEVDIKEWLKAVIMLGLGGYFFYNIFSGNVTNYINARFIWLSYTAGIFFIVYGLYISYTLIMAQRGQPVEHDHDHDHDHDHANWGILAVVSFPLLIGVLAASNPLGIDAVNNGVSLNAIGGEGGMTLSSDNAAEWHVLDWLRAFDASDDLTTFTGQQATVTGFIYREPDYGENTAMVTRFAVNCCVADATAIGLPVRGEGIADLEPGTWIAVTGAFSIGDFRGGEYPILTPEQIDLIEPPDPPYIYP